MIYKFSLSPKGPMGTPFRSDTLFGHACWCIALKESQNRLLEFLQNARDQKPELIFSDGFPAGYLPKPFFPIPFFEGESAGDQKKMKTYYKSRWIRREVAQECNWQLRYTDDLNISVFDISPMPHLRMRNTIDRMTGTSLLNSGLYTNELFYFTDLWEHIDIYVSTAWSRDVLSEFIKLLFKNGYGKDQSIGAGAVDVTRDPEPAVLDASIKSDRYLSLSRMVPDVRIDLKQAYYELEPKYGKVWSGLGEKNPFKKTILQTVPGSVFTLSPASETAGSVLSEIHDNRSVVENCMSVLYPLPEGAGYV
ncbi:hypothetical protein JXO52_03780 [bacterium]|nr:hypothetical protein [bacterium]